MPKLEQLKADMERNEAFRAYGAKAPDTATLGEQLQKYHEWLGRERTRIDEETGLNPDELRAHRCISLYSLSQTQAFLDTLRQRNPEYFDTSVRGLLGLSVLSWMRLPPTDSAPLVKHYRHWLDDALDDTTVAMTELGVRAQLGRDEREALTHGFGKYQHEDLGEARQAGLLYQQAKETENEVKRRVLALLGQDGEDVSGLSARKCGELAQAGIDRLIQEIAYCADTILESRRDHPQDPEEKRFRRGLRRSVRDRQELIESLELCQRQLRETAATTTGAEDMHSQETRMAELMFAPLNQKFRALNQKVVDAGLDLRTDVNRIEANIARKKLELQRLIALIPAQHEQLASESETLKKLQAYPRSEMRAEYARSVQELKGRIEATQHYHEQVARELAFLDAQYTAARDAIDQELEEHEQLLAMRDAAKDELAWIKKLRKVDKALNIYCSAFGVSFPLLLQIGHLVGGTGGGAVGGTSTALVAGLQGFFAAGGGTMGLLSGALETGGVGAILYQCKPYDTGSFSLSLKLGLSFGLPGDWGGKVGLALVYDAGINIQDDRRFRATSTLTVQAAAEASLPELFEASISADLVKDATTFEYKDHYQWAAWLAQKWANIFAWARACALYQRSGNRLDQPTPKDLANIRELALITLTNHPKTREIFNRTAKFMEEPILRVEQRELLGGMSAEVSFVEVFGAGFEGERPGEPHYIKREYDAHTQRLREMQKEGRNWSVGGSLTVLASVALTYSSTERHSNPDNNGYALNLKLSYPGTTQSSTWLNTPSQEAPATHFGEWIETHLSPLADKLSKGAPSFQNFSGPLKTTEFTQLSTALSLADIEINFVRSDLPDGKTAWVLQYWRPVFSSTTSLSQSIPLHAGINLDVGGSLGLSRSYKEQLGTNTLTYVRLVYHGFMNRTPPDFRGDPEKTRPEEAWGWTLWDGFAQAHKKQLYKLCRNVAKDDTWAAKEALLLTGHEAFIAACKKLPKDFDDKAFGTAKKALDTFLEAARKTDYHKDCEDGWKVLEAGEFMWSINPYQLALEIARTRSAAYKLDHATQGLHAPRRGLKEQIAEDRTPKPDGQKNPAYWIPDAQAPKCMACGVRFGLVTRRHHCRNCGGVFCGKCSSKQRPVPARGHREPVRVCDACDTLLSGKTGAPVRVLDPAKAQLAQGLRNPVLGQGGHPQIQAKPSSQHPLLPPKQDSKHEDGDGEFVMIIEESEPHKGKATDLLGKGGKPQEKPGLMLKGSGGKGKDSGTLNYSLTEGHQRLLEQARRKNLAVPANGDCLFAALVAMGAYQGTARQFRTAVAQQVRSGKIDVRASGIAKATLADYLERPGFFGGTEQQDCIADSFPQVIALALKANLHIYNPTGDLTQIEVPGAKKTYPLIRFEARDGQGGDERKVPHFHATQPL
ncbi:FYVE zinc finger [Methylomagnum ishizawai]|uniref:FYVE zinc finger n=1 Tax=Methylomagnum ishizawai TaxID=1760988 RepID=A0A1Y6CWR2_9GAMM|nr:FYVE zinc finger domain-containing protein [Methylomagnum ishizawai]SMF94706.1 FYVE zinc finger [Methylomagnum ishizawai]